MFLLLEMNQIQLKLLKSSVIAALCLVGSSAMAQPNDNLCGALALPINGSCVIGQSNIGSTVDWSGGCVGAGAISVWFEFTLTGANNTITVDLTTNTFGGGNVNLLLVENTTLCPVETPIFVDDYCGTAALPVVFTTLTPGIQYFLMVSTLAGNEGTFNICGTESSPPPGCATNGTCATAQVIAPISMTNVCAPGCNTGAPPGWIGGAAPPCDDWDFETVWYEVTIPTTDVFIDITVTSVDIPDPHIAVLNDCNTLELLSCQIGAGGFVNLSDYSVDPDSTYWIIVEGNLGADGNFPFA